tara:strand:+ start:3387 stop:3911 length:525 start_codon:yes stop_codon:yes gene_type:complete
MIPQKVKDHLDEYINQEVYVQIAIIKGKEKVSTKSSIDKYFDTNHFKDLSEGKPYDHFIDGLKDKCLGKLKNSPMRDKQSDDKIIQELQKKLNELNNDELDNTYWEIETGEFFSKEQIQELENKRNDLINELDITKNKDNVYKIIMGYCKSYEELCQKKYPEALLPLEILKSLN